MQLSLIIACNLHTAISDVCTINNVKTLTLNNSSKNLVLDVLLFKENPQNLYENVTVEGQHNVLFTFAPDFERNQAKEPK